MENGNLFTFVILFLGIGTIQGLILSYIVLFLKKGNVKANAMLALIVIIYSGDIFTSFVVFSGLYISIPHYVLIFYPLNRLAAPAFYLFVVFLLNPKRAFKWYDTLHCIPTLILFYTMLPFYELSYTHKINAIEALWFSNAHGKSPFDIKDLIINVIKNEPKLVYIIISLLLLKKWTLKAKNYASNTFIDFIDWLQKFTHLHLYFLLSTIIISIVISLLKVSASKTEAIVHLISTLFIHYIVFMSIREPEKLFFVFDEMIQKTTSPKPEEKIEKTSIEPLLDLMKEEKPYLDPDLKVHHLATMLDSTPHAISKLINQEKGVNFYTFINQYRVQEFMNRANSGAYTHLTLLGIALSVGFNSKSSFNRIFKKHTHMTPSEFINYKKVPNSNIDTSA